jgi:hypothetical protein
MVVVKKNQSQEVTNVVHFRSEICYAGLTQVTDRISVYAQIGGSNTYSVASPINECKKSAPPNVPVTSGGASPLGVLMMTGMFELC